MSLLSPDTNLTFLQMCKHSFKVVFDGQLTLTQLPQSGLPRGPRKYGPLPFPGCAFQELLSSQERITGWNLEFQVNRSLAKSSEDTTVVLCM